MQTKANWILIIIYSKRVDGLINLPFELLITVITWTGSRNL